MLIPPEDKTITLPNDVKQELVKVESGSFEMGARDGENDSDEVVHRATLKRDFYLGRTEVTQAQTEPPGGGRNRFGSFFVFFRDPRLFFSVRVLYFMSTSFNS